MRLKLSISVGSDGQWHTKAGNPTADKSKSHGLCGDVRHGEGFGPASKPVDTGEEIGVPPGGWKRANNVDVNLTEAGIWSCKCRQRGGSVTLDFGSLTAKARLGPRPDVGVHSWPNKTVSNEPLGGIDAWMRQ